ncbi:MAG: c-type cytochrome biogenesis protein CcmI, partial [Rhodospirillales bacterium]|nr:c-type cytochrome biogenesis protein CcmI [Rhodospirillales bacterium]
VEAVSKLSESERGEFIRSMVNRLAARLRDNPNDGPGWRRLARAYKVLGETGKAAEAEAKADALESGQK